MILVRSASSASGSRRRPQGSYKRATNQKTNNRPMSAFPQVLDERSTDIAAEVSGTKSVTCKTTVKRQYSCHSTIPFNRRASMPDPEHQKGSKLSLLPENTNIMFTSRRSSATTERCESSSNCHLNLLPDANCSLKSLLPKVVIQSNYDSNHGRSLSLHDEPDGKYDEKFLRVELPMARVIEEVALAESRECHERIYQVSDSSYQDLEGNLGYRSSSFIQEVYIRRMRVVLNVRGKIFETYKETLETFPDTLMGNEWKMRDFYDKCLKQYIFDRDIYSFDAILFYYQSGGILSRPYHVSRKSFAQEISFFEIEDYFDDLHVLEVNVERKRKETLERQLTFKQKLWETLEFRYDNTTCKLWYGFSLFVYLLSTVVLCADKDTRERRFDLAWLSIDASVTVVFIVEYIVRVSSSPSRRKYVKSPLGIIDLASIVPFFVNLIDKLAPLESIYCTNVARVVIIITRLLRVFKSVRYNLEIQSIIRAIYQSMTDIITSLVMVLINTLVFSTVIYHVEHWFRETFTNEYGIASSSSKFDSIPDAMWYCIITETTVGYGDLYPVTSLGKLMGAMCAVIGVILFCLRTPLLVTTLLECFYERELSRDHINPKRKAIIDRLRENLGN